MKNFCSSSLRSLAISTTTLICAVAVNALAQTNGNIPVVSVHAGDSSASESGDLGRFTFFRDGPTNLALNVYCVLDGTASNGVDYFRFPNWITFSAGVREVQILVRPIDDALVEGTETVTLWLAHSPMVPPNSYIIGLASNATVSILDNDPPPPTNLPPTINIVAPANGDVFTAPPAILVLAGVQDPDGNAAAATVEFFVGDHKIGNGQLTDPGPLHSAAFRFEWINVPPGEYDLSGKVTDAQGASAASAPVHLIVRGNPPTNQPPVVQISTPSNGAAFTAPADILICAAAYDLDGYVATVEFLAGDHSLGIRTNLCPLCAGPANPFCLMWTNVPPGDYVLRAKATDNLGAMSLSEPVQIRVREQSPLPVVTIMATDPNATEPCPASDPPTVLDPGRFTVRRDRGTNVAFLVYYSVSGTASNGVDYAALSGRVEIPVGRFEADIIVNPLADSLAEGPETVVLHLQPIACITIFPPPPDCYQIGPPSEAAVYIHDCDPRATNAPPFVRLDSPENGGVVPAPANIRFAAYAQDPEDGFNVIVEFFAGTHSLGFGTFVPTRCATYCPYYTLTWSNVPPGAYELTAKATDHNGASATSMPVHIQVIEPQPTNAPPRVFITTPTNGSVFIAPVNIPILTDTVDVDGYVWRVEFFANDHKIGEDSKLFLVAPPDGSHIGYDMVWSNPPPGLYALRAQAWDAAGASAFSEPVRISVIGTNPPSPTNFPPLVTLTAIDPIAAESTNCWRWYTNTIGWNEGLRTNYSGTNTATFVVRRGDPANASLTVYYAIGGSAANGVDYATLPGVVTIPAGERSARITLFPIDDAHPECTETVILSLLVSSNSPPAYLIGWPGKAAAIIVDNDTPPPDTRLLCDGTFHLSLPAPNNFNYRIECSLDTIHWVPASTNTVTDFNVRFVEPETADFPARFYRVVPETAPPPP